MGKEEGEEGGRIGRGEEKVVMEERFPSLNDTYNIAPVGAG